MTRNWTNRNSYGCEHVRPRDDWGESVEQWLSSMLAIGRTPETLRTRWYQIARFSRIVDRPIDQVDADAVIAFFLQSSMDLEAKRKARACVKVFYQWAVAHRIADHNPIDEVPVIPTRPRGGLICPEHAINEGLKSQDEDAVLAVMFGAWMGLRRLEMAQINIATDIEDNPEEMRLLVHGKGIKERVLPVPGELARAIRRRGGDWIFPGRFDGHACADYVGTRIKEATSFPSHSLRRRFATFAYYRTGCDILLVSQLLGHSSVSTTMRYIGINTDLMRDAMEATTRADVSECRQREAVTAFMPAKTMQGLTFGG